ncbi:dusp22b [Symbiodinium sp. CCMP2592]|nr:dusp22b [Symbiodinium sp. CCMP2592]
MASADISEIGPGLFLGSAKAATSRKALDSRKIRHVLVVDTTSSILWPQDFTYKRVKLDDKPTADLVQVLHPSISFISEAQLRRESALVHCTRGVSRSASVVIAYIMVAKGLSYRAARAQVEAKRAAINPNLGFEVQLLHFESLLASAPRGHLGEKLKWLRGLRSGLDVPKAMNEPVKARLAEARHLTEVTAGGAAGVKEAETWKELGSFFHDLSWYGVMPEDPQLLEEAKALAVSGGAAARKALGAWAKVEDNGEAYAPPLAATLHSGGASGATDLVLLDQSDDEPGSAKKQRTCR